MDVGGRGEGRAAPTRWMAKGVAMSIFLNFSITDDGAGDDLMQSLFKLGFFPATFLMHRFWS